MRPRNFRFSDLDCTVDSDVESSPGRGHWTEAKVPAHLRAGLVGARHAVSWELSQGLIELESKSGLDPMVLAAVPV
jgi:hypothetical protein